MKIIICYASAGGGHVKAAQALYNYLRERHPLLELSLVDVLDKSSALLKYGYLFGYGFLVKYAPWVWALGFKITFAPALRPVTRPLTAFLERLHTRAFSRYLLKENPDVILSTHFLPSQIAAHSKEKYHTRTRLFTIITDFGVHPFWIAQGTDRYVVASDYTKELLLSSGMREDLIRVWGIPVDAKFLLEYSHPELCKKIGIDPDVFTVLLMTGSFGIGPLEAIAKSLCADVQVVVVCASNKALYARLKRKNLPRVKVFGFVDNPQELMAVSQVILTKAGGLSIAEILSRELVPLFISAIPGQEEANIKALRTYGIGVFTQDLKEIRQIIRGYRDHPERLEQARTAMRAIKKTDTLKEIDNAVCKDCSGVAG